MSMNKILKYPAQRQNTSFPFLPIRGEKEKSLIDKVLNEVIANEESSSNQNVYENLSAN